MNYHFSYCGNIHPSATWEETFASLKNYTVKVRDRVWKEKDPFPIGLRLSALAASTLQEPSQLDAFRKWLDRENSFVFTINGFPYGDFHSTRVKENVFLPDWSQPERLKYTKTLFTILSQLLPRGAEGSVSTLPGSFKPFLVQDDGRRKQAILENLVDCARYIEQLSAKKNQDLHLGLEPEPLGFFENTVETRAFFRDLRQVGDADLIGRVVGVNYDTCHFAIEYEQPQEALFLFAEEEIRISKLHLSNALCVDPHADQAQSSLKNFVDDVYLHQVISKKGGGEYTRYVDLPLALKAFEEGKEQDAQEWRVHYHIPLYTQPKLPLKNTESHLLQLAAYFRQHPEICRQMEMETYTFAVLPETYRDAHVVDQLVKEYRWCQENFF